MIVIDVSIVITGLPEIRQELDFTTSSLGWIQSAYTLTFGGFLLLGARAGDLFGRKRMFQAGLILFTLSSLTVAMSENAAMMIAARAVQGVGGAILTPVTLAMLSNAFPSGAERSWAMSIYGAVAGLGASVGLVVGGILADMLSWRVGFFINLPIGLMLFVVGARYIQEGDLKSGNLDILGALLSTFGFGTLIWGILQISEKGLAAPSSWMSILAGSLLLFWFIRHEAKTEMPLVPLALFEDAERRYSNLSRFLFLSGMVACFFFVTQFMQDVMGFNSLEAGAGFVPMTSVNFLVAMVCPRVVKRFGNARVLLAGIALAFVAMALFAQVDAGDTYFAGLLLPMLVGGVGQGLCYGPLTTSGMARVGPSIAGAASGVVNMAGQIGSAFGIGLLTAVIVAAEKGEHTTIAIAHGIHYALIGSAVLVFLALLAALPIFFRASWEHDNQLVSE